MSKSQGKKTGSSVKVANKNAKKNKFAKKTGGSQKKSPGSMSSSKKKNMKITRKKTLEANGYNKPAILGQVCPKRRKNVTGKRKGNEPEMSSKTKLFTLKRKRNEEEEVDSSGDEAPGVSDYEMQPRMKFKKSLTEEETGVDETSKEEPGVMHTTSKNGMTSNTNNNSSGLDSDVNVSRGEEPKKEIPLIELIALKKKTFQETRTLVGKVCVSIIANPEANVNKLKFLVLMLDTKNDDAVFKLAFLKTQTLVAYALLEVFRDIIPSYRIREGASEEESKKLKKETIELRNFEQSLLKYYKMYVNRMERMVECIRKKRRSDFYDDIMNNRTAKENMCEVGSRCLAIILVSHPHFNLRDHVIQILVPLLSCKVPEIRQMVYDHITRLYREDKAGQVSHAAVKATGKLIKALKLNVHPLTIRSFISLNIKEVKKRDDGVNMNQVREKLSKMSRNEKKHNKALQKLKGELKETDAHEDQDKKLESHTHILNQIIYVFFRFIKDFIDSSNTHSRWEDEHVMTPVLEGLSKFAHLINIDFFDDLVSLLFRLLASGRMSGEQTLFCLNTVFTILAGEGSSLNVDPQRFYGKLYSILSSFDLERESTNHMYSVDDCMEKMLIKRKKQLSLPRVLAFCKRLSTMALHSSPKTAVGYLAHLRILLQDHSKADLLLDTDYYGAGKFEPELPDPDFCNANGTRVWELHLLRRHYHPSVERFASFHLSRIRNKKMKSDFSIKTPIQVHDDVLKMDDLETMFDENARKRGLHLISRKKHVAQYCFIDSPDSLTSLWTREMFARDALSTINE